MAIIKPFRALRPPRELAEKVDPQGIERAEALTARDGWRIIRRAIV